jgi:hypothetical protein
MICYQVLARFAFVQHKPSLVAATIRKLKAKSFYVWSGLPFGTGLKHRRFFRTKQEAALYVSYLYTVYKNRMAPEPANHDNQPLLFQEDPQ